MLSVTSNVNSHTLEHALGRCCRPLRRCFRNRLLVVGSQPVQSHLLSILSCLNLVTPNLTVTYCCPQS